MASMSRISACRAPSSDDRLDAVRRPPRAARGRDPARAASRASRVRARGAATATVRMPRPAARSRATSSSPSIARAVASTSSCACGVTASTPPVTSMTPRSRRVSGSCTGAAVHDHGWTSRLKCSAPRICTERSSASAVPGAEVPTVRLRPVRARDEAHVAGERADAVVALDPQQAAGGIADGDRRHPIRRRLRAAAAPRTMSMTPASGCARRYSSSSAAVRSSGGSALGADEARRATAATTRVRVAARRAGAGRRRCRPRTPRAHARSAGARSRATRRDAATRRGHGAPIGSNWSERAVRRRPAADIQRPRPLR